MKVSVISMLGVNGLLGATEEGAAIVGEGVELVLELSVK